MKLLKEKQLVALDPGTVLYFQEYCDDVDRKDADVPKYWGVVSHIRRNVEGIGYWVYLTQLGKFPDSVTYNHPDGGYARFSRFNRFYLPEKPTILRRYWQRALIATLDTYSGRNIGQFLVGNDAWF